MKANRGRYKMSAESADYLQRKRVTAKFMNNGKLTFGKWKGSALGDVVRDDPGYVTWAVQNIDGFKQCLTPKMFKALSKASKGKSGTKSHKKRPKPPARTAEGKDDPYRPRVQPPAEEERYFTAREMTMDPTFDVDASNADDSIPIFDAPPWNL